MSRGSLLDSYAGAFDPSVGLAHFSRQALAHIGREYLLLGHLIDRVGLPLVMQRFGNEAQIQFSIDEWMGASPIYSVRMQRAMGFEGDDVSTVFKNLQLDIGAPPQFMDFQFRLDRPDYGEFWLPHCGALMDVEPFGEKQVKMMCHDIEDPTFDATAAATNPRMKMRPIHRPPRSPAGRYPHCRWMVFIDDEATAYEQHANLARNQQTKLASIPIDLPDGIAEPGGWDDYSGTFDPGFQLEDLSHRALLIVSQEAAVQAHLLVRAFMLCTAQRFGDEAATELGARQWVGSAALGAHRMRAALGIEGDDIEAIAKVFQLHPHFWPRSYVDLGVEITGPRSARLSLGPCPALYEGDGNSWFAGLGAAAHSDHGVRSAQPTPAHPALDAIAGAINPYARCHTVADGVDGMAWDIIIEPRDEPQEEPMELNLARISRGAGWKFERRRLLRC